MLFVGNFWQVLRRLWPFLFIFFTTTFPQCWIINSLLLKYSPFMFTEYRQTHLLSLDSDQRSINMPAAHLNY